VAQKKKFREEVSCPLCRADSVYSIEGMEAAMKSEDMLTDQSASRASSIAWRSRADYELDTLCDSIRQRLIDGTMPPDDAYWWARIVGYEVESFQAGRLTEP
jgi:hypothetical protein